MELKDNSQLKAEILQAWIRGAWVVPAEGPQGQTFLRPTLGGRLKMRRRIQELEKQLGIDGRELARQEEAGTLPPEQTKLELAMMVQAYMSERRFIENQGITLGSAAIQMGKHQGDNPDSE